MALVAWSAMSNPADRDDPAMPSPGRYLRYTTRSGARWLLPERFQQRAAGVAMYVPYSLGGHARKALMVLGIRGRRVDGGDEAIGLLEAAAVEALERDDLSLSWYVADRRSESKTSALAIDARGRAVAFVKLAVTSTARRSLAREHEHLEALEAAFGGAQPAPRPLRWHRHEHVSVLVTSTAPARGGPRRFGPLHHRFLAALHERFGSSVPYLASPPWVEAAAFVEHALFSRASSAWRDRFGWGLERLEATLGQERVATTLAHRDFAPWNTRANDAGLFAFDWEFAAPGYPVNHDYFHFAFMVALLLRGGATPADARRWLRAVPVPGAYDGEILLAYLLDVARQYHGFHHDSTGVPDDPVLRQAARLIDGAAVWLRDAR